MRGFALPAGTLVGLPRTLIVPVEAPCPGALLVYAAGLGSRMECHAARRAAAGTYQAVWSVHRRRPDAMPDVMMWRWSSGAGGLAADDGSVDGRAGHAEQIAKLGGGVLAAVQQLDQMGFLARVELGLLAAQM